MKLFPAVVSGLAMLAASVTSQAYVHFTLRNNTMLNTLAVLAQVSPCPRVASRILPPHQVDSYQTGAGLCQANGLWTIDVSQRNLDPNPLKPIKHALYTFHVKDKNSSNCQIDINTELKTTFSGACQA